MKQQQLDAARMMYSVLASLPCRCNVLGAWPVFNGEGKSKQRVCRRCQALMAWALASGEQLPAAVGR